METYVLIGENFRYVPDNAIGVYSSSNAFPQAHVDTQFDADIFDIIEKSDNRMVLRARVPRNADYNQYLGCVLSSDRSIIYWTNTTSPLP